MPTWVSFVTGSASQPGTQARIVVLGGPRRVTQREMEVLHLVARGETDPGIAHRLSLSRRTISYHVANILTKLEVPSRFGLLWPQSSRVLHGGHYAGQIINAGPGW